MFVKGYGFLHFAKDKAKNVGQNISKKLSIHLAYTQNSHEVPDHAKYF